MSLFQAQWQRHISSFPTRYQRGEQIVHGSRLRPLLVALGYLLAGVDFDDARRADVASLAVYVELLHKATILIDDLIDDDSARNGVESFHVQFSDNETILFAIYLLGDSLERLALTAVNAHANKWYLDITQLLATAIKEMSSGAIEEVISAGDHLAIFAKARRLIELQTIALMKNGMLAGYKYGHGNEQHATIIESLGYDSGYVFQVLNDLEPFLSEDLNAIHKGAVNFDILRSRKNITVPFIYSRLSFSDRDSFHSLIQSADPLLPSVLTGWFVKYNVLSDVVDNLVDVKTNIEANANLLPLDAQRRSGFCAFVNYVLSVAIRRIGAAYGEKLSEILIK
ncbi:MAG TPA: polyprenyl synthetase family protein [Thermoanaerobaculia bacterium]|nr:polyprenyl synthetase family protein [Thermoanaerobaculia bacterium]